MALIAQRIIDALFFNQETDSTPIDQTYILLDHPSWSEPKKVLYPLTASESGILTGGNLITSSGWTSVDWTGNESIGWTHTTGNTTVLSNVIAAIIDSTYQIQITASNRTAGTFVVAFGGDTSIALMSSTLYSLTATTNGNLTITPTTDFDGTILIAIKEVVWDLTEEEILAILGKASLYSQAEIDALLALKVDKETGKSLLADTEIARLLTLKQNVYTINFTSSSSDIGVRCAAAIETTDYPTGWTLAAAANPNDLQITHNLARKIAMVSVFYMDGTEQILLMGNLGYTGVSATSTSILVVKGLSTKAFPLVVQLIFA
jgi:hypothetical protein